MMRCVFSMFAILVLAAMMVGLAMGYHYWDFGGFPVCVGEVLLFAWVTAIISNMYKHFERRDRA